MAASHTVQCSIIFNHRFYLQRGDCFGYSTDKGLPNSKERRLYIGSIAPDAGALANVVRAHWGIENRVHWCLDVALNDDQMRARMKNAGANLAIIRRLVLNLFRLDTSRRKGGIHIRHILAASSDSYREALLGLSAV